MAKNFKSMWAALGVSHNLASAFGVVLVFSFFVNILILTSPMYMMQVYDRVLASGQVETLLFLSLIALVALAVLGVLDGVRSYLMTRVGRYLDVTLRDPVLMQAIAQSRRSQGNQRRLVDDLNTARNYIGSPAVLPFMDAPWVPFFIAIIAMLHPWLGILAASSAVLLFSLALANDTLARASLRAAATQQMLSNEFASAAIQNSEVVHAMGMGGAISERYRRFVDDMGVAGQRAADVSAIISNVSKIVRIAVQSAVLGLGAYLVINAQMSAGGMIAASIVLGRALAPIEQTIGSWKQFVAARDAYKNLRLFFEDLPVADERISLSGVRGELRVEGVTYALRSGEKPVLNRISFVLEPGTALALVGPSASGKSTLCRMLVGASAPSLGKVRLDGADIMGLNPDDVSRAVGYLPQSVELFAGTVKDNIARLGVAKDEDVIAAARAAGCHDMILRLPAGYETELGSRGAFLSGGQRQRIGLARALFMSPRLIVLDEPNANLDQEGELALVEAISNAKDAGATIIVVSHRVSLLKPIDKLAVLRDGELDKFGDRDEVLRDLAPQQPLKPTLVATADAGNNGGRAS